MTHITLKQQFYGYQHDETHLIAEYISGITNLAAQLKTLDIKLNDTDIVDVLIFNLHKSWDNITSLLTATTGELKISDVTGALRMKKEGGVDLQFWTQIVWHLPCTARQIYHKDGSAYVSIANILAIFRIIVM